MKLHELSVKRPVAVTMAVLIFVVIGIYSLSMLSIEMMPDMNFAMAMVITQYENVGSSEVENLVTETVESAISSVSGIKSLTSQSSQGLSLVMAEFNNGVDLDKAVTDMKDKLDMIDAYLPDGADDPMVMKFDMNTMPVAMMSISVEGWDPIQTKKYIDDEVKSKLEAVNGVASVGVYGAQDREIEVVVDPDKMFGYNMSLTDLMNAIAAQNANLPSGQTTGMGKELSVRTVGKFRAVKDIEAVPIMTATGEVIYLRDVATVQDGYSDSAAYSRLNGGESLSVSVTKQSDANTVETVNGVISVLEQIKQSNPKFTYNMTMEQASYIEDAVSSVASNAITGGVLAVLILLLFLGSVRSSLIIGISMPVSIITTFIGMYFSGMSLNVVSLGGLALGVGMLVDNSVVVMENIFRHRTEHNLDGKTAGIKGAGEVVGAVCASVLTTCIVYVPILFINNVMAVMFKQLAFTIIFSQVASLLTTFLLIPMLSSRIKNVGEKDKHLGFILNPFGKFMDGVYVVYEKSLRWVLAHRKTFIGATLLLFVLSLVVLGQLGMILMAPGDEGTLSVNIELPQGTELETTDELSRKVEDMIAENPNVKTISATVGSDTMGAITGSTTSNASTITVTLVDKKDRKASTNDVAEQLRQECSGIAGAEITVEASNNTMSMSTDEIQFNFTGSDDEALEEYVLEAEKLLAQTDGITETSTSISDVKSEVRIYPDDSRASQYGLNTRSISSAVSAALDGTTASRLTEGGKEYDIVLSYPEEYVKNYNELQNLRLKTPRGEWITLGDVADVKVENGYTTLTRLDQKRTITLKGKMYNTDMQTVNNAFNEKLKTLNKPDGVSQVTGGSYEIMIDAMVSLLIAILLGILLMYMVMAAQFENLVQPFLILFTVPLSMIGVVLSLVIAGSPLSVVSTIGILMLVGIVVNNAIVLIDFINTAKKEQPEADRNELVVYAGKTRLRPVLMTSITSILGFLPMAVSNASGSEMMQPLAVVLVGGLLVGTLLTLLFIPAIYTVSDDRRIKKLRKRERAQKI